MHPDKHPGNEDARRAFEALKETHKILTDRGTLVSVCNNVKVLVDDACGTCCACIRGAKAARGTEPCHPQQQEEALKSKLPEAILRRERNKAAASLDERIVMAAEEHKRAQELLKEEVNWACMGGHGADICYGWSQLSI